MIEDKLPNVSWINIKVQTNFKPQIEDGEDFRTEVIKAFHSAVFKLIETDIIENDVLEEKVLELMSDNRDLPKDVKEFSDLGEVTIIISEDKVKVKQKSLYDNEVKLYLANKNVKVDKDQTKLQVN